jgi:hypothetical protein
VVPKSADFVLTRLQIDLQDSERVDIEVELEGLGPVKVMPDVAFERDEGAIYGCCEGELARQVIGMAVRSRFWGHGPNGRRHLAETVTQTELGT